MVAQLFDAGALEQERPDDWEPVLVYNAVTVLFGTVRTVYADLSAASPTGRIVLPAVNVGQILDRDAEAQVREAVEVAFGQAVARRIVGFAGGAEGLCLYQNLRSIERDLGFVDVMHSAPDGTTTYDQQLLLGTITAAADHVPLFLKEKTFAHQAECRLFWFTDGLVPPYLNINAPEARQFCSPKNERTE